MSQPKNSVQPLRQPPFKPKEVVLQDDFIFNLKTFLAI